MEIQLKIIGALLILLALIHIIFPKYFHWKKELELLSLVNKQMMKVHTLFIALTLLLMGILCITSTTELITTNLGKQISLGFGIFWGVRLFIQFFGYSTKLWIGKTFETIIHIIFTFLWAYLTWTFIKIYLT
jgi:hypothetical protein